MTRADADHAGRCLHQVWEELTGRGYAADEPTAFCCMSYVHGLHGMQAMMDPAITGALVAEFIPLPPAGAGPEPAARLVLALLGGEPVGSLSSCPAAEPGMAVNEAAGRMLAAAGLAARAGQFRYSDSPRDLCTEVMVISPAALARGDARISDTGTVLWECRFAGPDGPVGRLTPAQVACAIAAALAGYRDTGSGRAYGGLGRVGCGDR